ncbi:MAG TPA: hypothetical protein VKF15_07370 [Nitrososphaerales archaeon]|nr:hypothetical protein [Nitrososphaerales archaeon]
MMTRVFVAVAVLVMAGMAVAAFYPGTGGIVLTTTSGSLSGTSTTTSTASTACTTSSGTAQQTVVLNGTFTYSPHLPVKVNSVQALIYTSSAGVRTLVFSVSYENDGAAPIYVPGGCGGALDSAIVSASGVVQRVNSTGFCACPEFVRSVDPGTGAVATGPGCWSGYGYRVVGSGTIEADLTLKWSGPAGNSTAPTTASITATFHLPEPAVMTPPTTV